MKRLAVLLIPVALLATGLLVRSQAPDAARASYQRGNDLLKQARRGTEADRGLLGQAAEAYRACLSHEAATPGAADLFDNARYNLELTRLLMAQTVAARGPRAGSDPPAREPRAATDPPAPKGADPTASGWNDKPKSQASKDKCPTCGADKSKPDPQCPT